MREEVACEGRAIVCICDNVQGSQCSDTSIAAADVVCITASARKTNPHHRVDVMDARKPCASLEIGASG